MPMICAYMPTLERLKAVEGLGFATPPPENENCFSEGRKMAHSVAFWILNLFSQIFKYSMKNRKLAFYIYTSQTSFPRTRMGRLPWMARTYLKVPPIFHLFLS